MNQELLHKCIRKDHSSLVTDINNGEIVCSSCGMVLKEKTEDRTPNSRIFTTDAFLTKTKNGPPIKISKFDMGNSSIISKKNTDASGNTISTKNKQHFSRLRTWDKRSKKNSRKANLIKAFTILDSLITKLSLPENVKENSAYIYRKAAERNIIQGHSVRSVMAASVYASCKQLDIPRNLDEIANNANVKRRTLSRTYRLVVKKLELTGTTKDIDYVSKVANSVQVSEKIKRLSSQILSDAKKSNIHVGKNPVGLAAGAVYLSAIGSGKNISMAKISEKVNISTVTIRKINRLLRPFAAKYIETITG